MLSTKLQNYFNNRNSYCISLDKNVNRQNAITFEFEALGIKTNIYFGINPAILKIKSEATDVGYGQTGCFLSHISIYSFIVANKIKECMIFEDDTILNYEFYERNIDWFDNALDNIPNKTDIIYFGSFDFNSFIGYNIESEAINEYFVNYKNPMCTHAYLITYNGCMKILKSLKEINKPLDWYLINLRNNNILNSCSIKYNLFVQNWEKFSSDVLINNIPI